MFRYSIFEEPNVQTFLLTHFLFPIPANRKIINLTSISAIRKPITLDTNQRS